MRKHFSPCRMAAIKKTASVGEDVKWEPSYSHCWECEMVQPLKKAPGQCLRMFNIESAYGQAVRVLHSVCQQIWKTQQWPQDWKRSILIPIPKKGNAKKCSNYRTVALISHASKVMLKICQARLEQYMNMELPDVQDRFKKGRGTRNQIANIHGIMEKAREFKKKHLLFH